MPKSQCKTPVRYYGQLTLQLFFKRGSNSSYYTALEITKSTKKEDIRIAYRRLSLMLHPDKIRQTQGRDATEEEKARFQLVQRAYIVLTDVNKRPLYDLLGDEGLSMYENPTDPNVALLIVSNVKRNVCLLFGSWLGIVIALGLYIVPSVMVCAKIDGDIDAKWVLVWIPFWILIALAMVEYCGSIFFPDTPDEQDGAAQDATSAVEALQHASEEQEDKLEQVYSFVFWLAFAAFSVLLTTRMDGYTSYSYMVVFVPWIAYEIFAIFLCLYRSIIESIPVPAAPVREVGDMAEEQDIQQRFVEILATQMSYSVYFQRIIRKWQCNWEAIDHVLRIILALLIAMKIDGDLDRNWRTVFVPVYLSMTLWMLLGYYQYTFLASAKLLEITALDFAAYTKVQSFFGGGVDLLGTPDLDDIACSERVTLALAEVEVTRTIGSTSMIRALAFVIMIPMLVTRLDGLNNINAFKIITPWFMLCGILVLMCCCLSTFTCCNFLCIGSIDEFNAAEDMAGGGPTHNAEAHFSDTNAYEAPTVVTVAVTPDDAEGAVLSTTANVVNDSGAELTRSAQVVTAIDEGID